MYMPVCVLRKATIFGNDGETFRLSLNKHVAVSLKNIIILCFLSFLWPEIIRYYLFAINSEEILKKLVLILITRTVVIISMLQKWHFLM